MRYLRFIFVLLLIIPLFFTSETADAASGDTYEVSSMLLHVRDEPAANASVIGLLHEGDKVTVFQEKYGWVQTYYSGKVGWVAKHHLIPTASVTQAADTSPVSNSAETITISAYSVNVRSGPGLDYPAIAGTQAGEHFSVTDRSGDWVKVSLSNGQAGWIAGWLTSAGGTEVKGEAETKTEAVATETQATAPQQQNNRSLDGFNIVLDAAHGGRDPGAIGLEGVYEKHLSASTTSQIAATLRSHGANVIETRSGDYYLSLDERADISNAYHTHAFISVHYNAFPVMNVNGVNTFYYGDSSQGLANNVHRSLAAALPLNDRGVVPANYKVLRNTTAPAILLELGFLTNAYDLAEIRSSNHPHQVADAIAEGLLNYFQ